MTTHNVHTQESAATSKFAVSMTPDKMVTKTQQVVTVVQAHPLWADPSLKQSVTQWQAAAQAIDARDQAIKAARLTLTGLVAARMKDITTWKRATRAVLSTVDTVSVGSAQTITQLGFSLDVRQPAPPSTDPPLGLHVRYSKSLVMAVKWKAVKGNRGYTLEIGDAAGQTFAGPIACVKSSYEPQGLVPGTKVTFRVAVQRKEGLSVWSDVVTATVR